MAERTDPTPGAASPTTRRDPASAAFLAEAEAKQAAYAAARRRHVAVFESREDDAADDARDPITGAPSATNPRSRRRIDDKRQMKLEL